MLGARVPLILVSSQYETCFMLLFWWILDCWKICGPLAKALQERREVYLWASIIVETVYVPAQCKLCFIRIDFKKE